MPIYSLIFLLTLSCTLALKNPPSYQSPEEVILSTQYLSLQLEENKKIECLKNDEETFLLLRTIRPAYEMALSQMNKNPSEQIFGDCHKNCTCEVYQILETDKVIQLTKEQVLFLKTKKKEHKVCQKKWENEFCKSELYQKLSREKNNFSLE
jgi:hypothetical protein